MSKTRYPLKSNAQLRSVTLRKKSEFLEFGSSDWTRTSDIRINSPPFYRLNYRGIV